MKTLPLSSGVPLDRAIEVCCQTVRNWIQDSIREYNGAAPTNGHDQGTYMTGWEPYIHITNDTSAILHMKNVRDMTKKHFDQTGLWKHGYWKMQEAHHGTEHFELFLGALFRLDPEDGQTISQLDDAAEHMGNWSGEVPDWYDRDQRRYHSMYFGADGVKRVEGSSLNVPDHLRCINICLLAYKATGNHRYLDLSTEYGMVWCRAILANPLLPIGLDQAMSIYSFEGEMNETYRSFVGQLPSDVSNPLDVAEIYLAAGAIQAFLDIYILTKKIEFLQTVEKLLDNLIPSITDPDAGSVADIVRKYRRTTGLRKYDRHIIDAMKSMDPFGFSTLSLDANHQFSERPTGIGKRTDMLLWYEDGQPRKHNPILLAAAAEITNDSALASRSVELAGIYLELAQGTLSHGREHGCKAKTISSVARGHGRENHAGVTTAVLRPIAEVFLGVH